MLDTIDAVLARRAEVVDRTRKGREWDIWIGGRPVHVSTNASLAEIKLSAGCNSPEDYALLRQLALDLAAELHGQITEPQK